MKSVCGRFATLAASPTWPTLPAAQLVWRSENGAGPFPNRPGTMLLCRKRRVAENFVRYHETLKASSVILMTHLHCHVERRRSVPVTLSFCDVVNAEQTPVFTPTALHIKAQGWSLCGLPWGVMIEIGFTPTELDHSLDHTNPCVILKGVIDKFSNQKNDVTPLV